MGCDADSIVCGLNLRFRNILVWGSVSVIGECFFALESEGRRADSGHQIDPTWPVDHIMNFAQVRYCGTDICCHIQNCTVRKDDNWISSAAPGRSFGYRCEGLAHGNPGQ